MNIEIANRLVQYRKARGMSQEELAAALGLSRQAVSKWERAEASPDTDNLIALAKLYSVSLDTLLLAEAAPLSYAAQSSSEVLLGSEPPEAPTVAAEEVSPGDYREAAVPRYYGASRGWGEIWEDLSPGAKSVLKLGLVVAATMLFFVYGLFSLLFHGLNNAYAPLCTAIYLLLGFVWGKWHPGWLIFMTIPIFYTLF